MIKGFASDNYSGVHPTIIDSINKVNFKHTVSYGDDLDTKRVTQKFRKCFGNDVDTYFVFNGTAANVLALKTITNSFNSIICAETAHINVDECGSPENHTGCKLIAIPTKNGKITAEQVKKYLEVFGDQHRAQPKVISITQPTELGTLYTNKEVKTLAILAHNNNLLLHMDGARFSNAVAALNQTLKESSFDLGVDVLSFGGTKNGMLFGEAIIFRNSILSKNFCYVRKQGMQLFSKMRFISAQFEAFLHNDLWLENARHSNYMALLLAEELAKIPSIKITQEVETNAVFAIISNEYITKLQKEYPFYVWNNDKSEVRWMCSFDTTQEDIHSFISLLKKYQKNTR